MTKSIVLGVMSGSSLDGLDFALCQFKGLEDVEYEILSVGHSKLPPILSAELKHAAKLNGKALCLLDVQFGKFIGLRSKQYLRRKGISVDLIAVHGHTVFHEPADGFSLQLGHGAHIAQQSGIPACTDFRTTDISKGGQGAPLAFMADQFLFPGYAAYLNLGGIVNMTVLNNTRIISYDICGGNQVLNMLAGIRKLKYDDKGAIAREGKPIESLLLKALDLPFHKMYPPKSLSNDWVQNELLPIFSSAKNKLEHRLATMVEYIAHCVAVEIKRHVKTGSGKIFTTGGGAHNTYLIERINEKLGDRLEIFCPAKTIIDGKEAMLMAFLGYLRMHRQINTFAKATGASGDGIGGTIYL